MHKVLTDEQRKQRYSTDPRWKYGSYRIDDEGAAV